MEYVAFAKAQLRLPALVLLLSLGGPLLAQETRGMIYGRVLDPQAAAVVGAKARVINLDTNTSSPLVTNETGYYEANLLLPGNYQVSAEAAGFRTAIRSGIVLLMDSRVAVNVNLEVGGVADSVTVVAEAPLLEAAGATSGRVVDNRTQTGLPVSLDNVTLFARLVAGVQSNGEVRVLGPVDNGSGSDYKVNGSAGGNQWTLNGAPNNGFGDRTIAYLPHSDTVSEMKVETSGFDASFGHSTGALVSAMSKSGTNRHHGTVSELHNEKRWNATDFFVRQLRFQQIAAAEAAGNQALAQSIRSAPLQPSGYTPLGPTGVGVFIRNRTVNEKLDFSLIRGRHSLRGGVDVRGHFRTGGGGGNTSGNFTFGNTYTRRNDDTFPRQAVSATPGRRT